LTTGLHALYRRVTAGSGAPQGALPRTSHGGAATLSTERCGDAVIELARSASCLLAYGLETGSRGGNTVRYGRARRFGCSSSTSLNQARSDDALGMQVRRSSRSGQPSGAVWTVPERCLRADRKRQRSEARVPGPLSQRRRGSSRTRRSPPRPSPSGRVAARTDRSKLANANTVATGP
jgi:hypothetical protein